jgi:hypothetical protein
MAVLNLTQETEQTALVWPVCGLLNWQLEASSVCLSVCLSVCVPALHCMSNLLQMKCPLLASSAVAVLHTPPVFAPIIFRRNGLKP